MNNSWFGASLYVSNTTDLVDAVQCGMDLDFHKYYDPKNEGAYSKFQVLDMMRSGGTARCRESSGPIKTVMLVLKTSEATLCNVGIFTCYCNNITASRVEPFEPSNIILYDDAYEETFLWDVPLLIGKCSLCDYELEIRLVPTMDNYF